MGSVTNLPASPYRLMPPDETNMGYVANLGSCARCKAKLRWGQRVTTRNRGGVFETVHLPGQGQPCNVSTNL